MAEGDEQSRIRAYIEQNQTTYASNVLRANLLDAGYDRALVDQALAELEAAREERYRASVRQHKPGQFYLGLVLFAPFNLLIFGQLRYSELSVITAAFVSVGAVVALSGLSWLLDRRDLAAGLVSGYALLTILSRGSFTLGVRNVHSNLVAFLGLSLYLVALAVLGIVLAIYTAFRRRQR